MNRSVIVAGALAVVTTVLALHGQNAEQIRVASSPVNIKQPAVSDPSSVVHGNSVMLPPLLGQVRNVDLVLIGHVDVVESAFDDARTHIFTYTTIAPSRILKGSVPDKKLVIRTRGGTVGDIASGMIGQPHFKHGEEVLLILDWSDTYQRYIFGGYPLSVFHIENDSVLGKIAVIDYAYNSSRSEAATDPRMDKFLEKSRSRHVTLDELLITMGLAP